MKQFMNHYESIRINVWQLLTDPIFAIFCWPCNKNFGRRISTLEKCEDKMAEELNIMELIKKIRLSNDFLKNLLRKDQQQLLHKNKSWLIDISESSCEDSCTSSGDSKCNSDNSDIQAVDQPEDLRRCINQLVVKGIPD